MTFINSTGCKLLLISFSALTLTACEDPFDCIVDDRPVLNTENLQQPILNQEYASTISVSIKNNSQDNRYDYSWRLSGTLPAGISYQVNNRELVFSGTATSLGDYPYTVSVNVSSDDFWNSSGGVDASELCRQNVTRNYTMTVAPL
ncbi:MAG: putative Ig domain-containing protein [Granulosicoccus sp.]